MKFPLNAAVPKLRTAVSSQHKTRVCENMKGRETKMEDDEDDYKYLRIQDAISSIGQHVSIVAIVSDAAPPRPIKGSDFLCTLKVVDESRPEDGLIVKVIGGSESVLPCVNSVGDIIILSRVKVMRHSVSFIKKSSSFALYEGSHGKSFSPYQASANFHPTDRDKKFVAKLRKSLVNLHVVSGSQVPSPMKDTCKEERCTMICKVLYIHTPPNGEWCAFIWDGTDVPPLHIINKLEDEMSHPIPLQLETFSLPIETVRRFPVVGTILRMVAAKGMKEIDISTLVCNKWFKIVNMILEVHAGLWQAVVMPFTRLIYLPGDEPSVIECARKHKERVSNSWGHMPFWYLQSPSLITAAKHESVDFVTLREVLAHKSVTFKFKCVVRVLALIPWRATDFRDANGIYRLRLTLEDATGRVHAFVYAEDGESLFGQNPTITELTNKRNKLLGIPVDEEGNELMNSYRNPPWYKCCIKSYYLNKKDPWGSRHYGIFDIQFEN